MMPPRIDEEAGAMFTRRWTRIRTVRLIMRPPSAELRQALSEHPERDQIDPLRAQRQHAAFVQVLTVAGIEVRVLPAEPQMPDACFTWDTVLAVPPAEGGATALLVAARPGALSRRVGVAPGPAFARRLGPHPPGVGGGRAGPRARGGGGLCR